LPSGDESGSADPFVKVYCDGKEFKTEVNKDTLNPIYYLSKELPVEFEDPREAPPIIILVYDWDQLGNDDLLGQVVIDMTEALVNEPDVAVPKWYDLDMGTPNTKEGAVLASFNLLPKG